jgi:hypothetical protein
MKKAAVMLFMTCLIAASAFAFELTADNISETDGFVVEVAGTDVTVKNNLGTDAFKVYVLIYTEDFLNRLLKNLLRRSGARFSNLL